ncbi:MAG: methyltransferase domain-containing protein [Bacteroidota bacterium]|nr:methyltransferase domain-containing protein [Bacteroidota bacterium]MDP4230870.1 methyltransferase domain-containing protein [Bacteroidota bacterium]
MENIPNYFISDSAAERYKKGRPYFHPIVIEQIRNRLSLKARVELALDVACGTGLSAKSLLPIASKVIGIDSSEAMLSQCELHPRITFLHSPAENLPVSDQSIDMITVSQGIHWFDQGKFFGEVVRVLKPRGRVAIYDNFFKGQLIGNEHFAEWMMRSYYHTFPVPPRRKFVWENVADEYPLLEKIGEDRLTIEAEFNRDSLVAYLTTQSNVIGVVEGGTRKIEDVQEWLAAELSTFFPFGVMRSFLFESPIEYFKKR